jgi:hypothetical protein
MLEPTSALPVAEPAPGVVPGGPTEAGAVTEPATALVAAGAWPDVSTAPAGPHCPWCSASLASADLTTCPNCGAQLNAPAEADVPGVTKIDVAALAWKAGGPPRRSKILSWISGESDDLPDSSGASASAVEPPSLAVRREMLRLELEAEGITLPHDAEPSAAEEADAVAEAGSGDSGSGDAGSATPGA